MRFDFKRRGLLIPVQDMLIAATAIHHGLTLVTKNRKDFERITNLTLSSP